MTIQDFLDEMRKIQKDLLWFIDQEVKSEENFANLSKTINDLKVYDDKNKLNSLLHLIMHITNNHHRYPDLYLKIDQILRLLKNHIKTNFTNTEIFNIFGSNKRVLLFLIEEEILKVDHYFVRKITTEREFQYNKYPQYFSPEIRPFMAEKWFPKKNYQWNDYSEILNMELPEDFYENRKIGENEGQICRLIRNDKIDDFIIFMNKNCISVNSDIIFSVYETNPLLAQIEKESIGRFGRGTNGKNGVSLIEYAAFFGSIQIFKYLEINEAKFTQSLWLCAIHGQNSELIQLVNEKVRPTIKKFVRKFSHSPEDIESFVGCYEESIKCHHIDITNYFLNNNFLKSDEQNPIELLVSALKYYNFEFIQSELINESSFFNLCKYDHCILVDILLKSQEIDINKKIKIFIKIFGFNFNSNFQIKFKFQLFKLHSKN